jgi:hypothetical protein
LEKGGREGFLGSPFQTTKLLSLLQFIFTMPYALCAKPIFLSQGGRKGNLLFGQDSFGGQYSPILGFLKNGKAA